MDKQTRVAVNGTTFETRHGPWHAEWTPAGRITRVSDGSIDRHDTPPPAIASMLEATRSFLAGGATWPDARHLLDLSTATNFQRSVYSALLDLPPGATTTYSGLAQRIGKPAASRAVGAALGSNPILLLVPCHRVIGRDGSLTGFAAGLSIKRRLLKLEGALLV